MEINVIKILFFFNDIDVSAYMVPQVEKFRKGGEDSYYISIDGGSFGVFDGVGGWADAGVDPREYSYALAAACKSAADDLYLHDPLEILQYAYDKIKIKNVVGSCTAVIAQVSGSQLSALNLGDSGLRVLRNGGVVSASLEQQHIFNMPFQLGTESKDKPKHAQRVDCDLKDGDIVVLGTDGLFDNMFDNKISKIVKEIQGGKAQDIAKKLAEQAFEISNNERAFTPFVDNAKKQGHLFEGGKPDDITVLVAKYNEINAKL